MKKITKKITTSLFLIIFLISLLFIYTPINAQEYNLKGAETFMETVGGGIGYDTATTQEIFIGNLIKVALSLIGIFFLILVILGGYQWMTAGGNEESIAKAKKRIINATIGLVVVLGAYILAWEVLDIVLTATGR